VTSVAAHAVEKVAKGNEKWKPIAS
jgi:hypothetical protein